MRLWSNVMLSADDLPTTRGQEQTRHLQLFQNHHRICRYRLFDILTVFMFSKKFLGFLSISNALCDNIDFRL